MSRHRLQLEAALLQGKAHLPLAHIYVNGAKKFSDSLTTIAPPGASVNDILLSDEIPYPSSPPSSPPHLPENTNKITATRPKAENGTTPPTQPENIKVPVEEKKVIKGKVESILESEIEAGKLPQEEIAKQFPKYSIGTPSKVSIIFFYYVPFCNVLTC